MNDSTRLLTVGWREMIRIPAWGIEGIVAKIDTGARSSAIDVLSIEELADERVRFDVALSRRNRNRSVTVTAPIARRTRVRSSNGLVHERLLVEAELVLGPVHKIVELGLVCRQRMICRMLLGRQNLAGSFLIDPGGRYLLHGGKRPKRRRHR